MKPLSQHINESFSKVQLLIPAKDRNRTKNVAYDTYQDDVTFKKTDSGMLLATFDCSKNTSTEEYLQILQDAGIECTFIDGKSKAV